VTFKIVQLVELKYHTEGRAKTEVDACDMDDTGKWVRFVFCEFSATDDSIKPTDKGTEFRHLTTAL
jgi:hypothetical protein